MASQLRAIRRKTQQVATIAAGITALATTTAVVIHRRRQRTRVLNSDQKTPQTFRPALQIENGFILIGHMRTSTACRTSTPVAAVGGHSSERHIGNPSWLPLDECCMRTCFWVMDNFAVDRAFFLGRLRSSLPTCSDSSTSSEVYAWKPSVIVIIYGTLSRITLSS